MEAKPVKASEWTIKDTRFDSYIENIKRDDVFLLSDRHLLYCGDSLIDLNRFMSSTDISTMFTSPPYKMSHNLSWKNKNSELKSKYLLPELIKDYPKFLTDTTNRALDVCDYAFVNLQSLSNNKRDLLEYLYNLRDRYVDVLVWDKGYTAYPVVPNIFRSDFEFLYIFSREKNPPRTIRCAPKFQGNISNVQHIRRKNRNEFANQHNATFPREFSDFVVEYLCGSTVLDMFAGTGTTLMSCEKFNRTWYGIEIVPEYCKIILDRWIRNGGKVEKV